MHISDGILSAPVLITGFIGTIAVAAYTMRQLDLDDIPKVSVITSVFFVASLIHVPIGPSSVHLILGGLVGVVLGVRAFPAIMLGIILQTILFGHGGVTVIGVNTMMLGGGGLIAYGIWQLRHRFDIKKKEMIFGGLAGAAAIFSSGIVLALSLVTTGEEFIATAIYTLVAHIPVMIIEAMVVGACAAFLAKVKPDALAGQLPLATPPLAAAGIAADKTKKNPK